MEKKTILKVDEIINDTPASFFRATKHYIDGDVAIDSVIRHTDADGMYEWYDFYTVNSKEFWTLSDARESVKNSILAIDALRRAVNYSAAYNGSATKFTDALFINNDELRLIPIFGLATKSIIENGYEKIKEFLYEEEFGAPALIIDALELVGANVDLIAVFKETVAD